MASIKLLPSGKWNVRIRRHGYPLVTKTFTAQKDADRYARQTEAEMDRGVFVDRASAEATTLGQALERYGREVSSQKKGAEIEAFRLGLYSRHILAKRSLASLKASDFAELRDERLRKGASAATVRRDFILLSHVFTVARQEWSLAIKNPIEDVRKPSGSKARNRRLVGDEYSRLLQACQEASSGQLAPLFVLAVETGMRLGELLKLTWDDVDLTKRVVMLWETKNGSARQVPLSRLAVTTLDGLARHFRDRRVFFTWARSDSVKQAWRRAMKKAAVDGLTFHDLRHEAVSRLFEAGLNPLEVASISGHKTMQMLARYTHLQPNDLLKKLDQRAA